MTVPPGPYEASPQLLQNAITRRQISQFSGKTLGINIVNDLGPADPDTINVEVWLNSTLDPNTEGTRIITGDYAGGRVIKRDIGIYVIPLPPEFTINPALVDVHWSYTVGNTGFTFVDFYEIVEPMPVYESLSDSQKLQVDKVNWMMGDLFDSTAGGPNFQETFQAHYNYERMAQLLSVAVSKINYMFTPITHYVVGGEQGKQFPENFSDVIMLGLYIETMQHFIRSYVEQPNIQGSPGVSFTDRREYLDRWRSVKNEELDMFKNAVREFKRKNELRLGSTSMIVSGGIWGGAGRQFRSGAYAAQTRAMSNTFNTAFVLPVSRGSM